MRSPNFWYPNDKTSSSSGIMQSLMAPLGALYAFAGRAKAQMTTPHRCSIPVICVGNLTAGGTGKTPLTLAIAKKLKEEGESPFILSRGYGGTNTGPVQVNPELNSAADVGDEPLLLAQQAPTVVSVDRAKGGDFCVRNGASVILMDDGYQNPGLHKDVSLLVVDGEVGFGNGKVIPAGPLRENIQDGLKRASAVICMQNSAGEAQIPSEVKASGLTQFTARLMPKPTGDVARQRVIAFSGIGRPEKFFKTAELAGYKVVDTYSFDDHHPFTEQELSELHAKAKSASAELLTTEKDAVRLSHTERAHIQVLPIEARVSDMTALMDLLRRNIQSFRTHPPREAGQK